LSAVHPVANLQEQVTLFQFYCDKKAQLYPEAPEFLTNTGRVNEE
jgi:hypothetical protein